MVKPHCIQEYLHVCIDEYLCVSQKPQYPEFGYCESALDNVTAAISNGNGAYLLEATSVLC
jgi:hypothetical protein